MNVDLFFCIVLYFFRIIEFSIFFFFEIKKKEISWIDGGNIALNGIV